MVFLVVKSLLEETKTYHFKFSGMKTLHFIYKKTSSAFLEFLCTSLHLGPYNSNCIMK